MNRALRTASEIRDSLGRAGIEGECRPLWGKMPFSNYRLTFRRKQE